MGHKWPACLVFPPYLDLKNKFIMTHERVKTTDTIHTIFNQFKDSTSSGSSSLASTSASPSPIPTTTATPKMARPSTQAATIPMPNELFCLARDLKHACVDLATLIKKINSIANCFEEKLVSIFLTTNDVNCSPNLAQSGSQTRSYCNPKKKQVKQNNVMPKENPSIFVAKLNQVTANTAPRLTDSSSAETSLSANQDVVCDGQQDQSPIKTTKLVNHHEELLWFVEKLSKKPRSKSQPVIKIENQRRPASLCIDKSDDSSDDMSGFLIDETNRKIDTMESSFYEDKLDDDLEKYIDCYKPADETICKKGFSSRQKNNKSKPANQQAHHVCFNLNNTIYTTKTDDPPVSASMPDGSIEIPIRIAKDTDPVSKLSINNNKQPKARQISFAHDLKFPYRKSDPDNSQKSLSSFGTATSKPSKLDLKITNL